MGICLRHHAILDRPSYNPHSYSPLVLQPTFDLWPWVNLAQNLISSSTCTPGGTPLYQARKKLLKRRVRIFYFTGPPPVAQVLKKLMSGGGGVTPPQPPPPPFGPSCLYQVWWKSRLKIAYLDQVHWPLANLAQYLISSYLLLVVHPCTN